MYDRCIWVKHTKMLDKRNKQIFVTPNENSPQGGIENNVDS